MSQTKMTKENAAANMPQSRNSFQQKLEELKIRVMEKALRDMDVTIRILKDWMKGH